MFRNGEGGIRTHAPFRTNGFQDRLVMTASIPLQTCFSILQHFPDFVKYFFHFFEVFSKLIIGRLFTVSSSVTA